MMAQSLTYPDSEVQIEELPGGKRRLTYRKIKWLLKGLLAVIKALSGMTLVPNLSLVIRKDTRQPAHDLPPPRQVAHDKPERFADGERRR
jgi:hypothetical protein